jgi:hypothetical protein
MKDIASATETSTSIKSLGSSKTRKPLAGFGVVGINTEIKFDSHEASSKTSKSSHVINQTDHDFSIGNLVITTFLKEFVFFKVLAA